MATGSLPNRRSKVGGRTLRASRPRSLRVFVTLATVASACALVGVASAVSFHVGSSLERVGGTASTTEFLSHWQFVSTAPSTTPFPTPRVWSATVATPTRLARLSTTYLLNRGAFGDTGADWVFNETVGISASTELEVAFSVTYVVAGVTHSFTTTAYVETQARALVATLTFTVLWDSGAATALTVVSQTELTQVCSALGTCP